MKRFHVNLSVADLQRSIDFYKTLFAAEPTVVKQDYAKWMLDDPKINFSISESHQARGVNHVGLQVDSLAELGDIQARLSAAQQETFEQAAAECCYAKSTKTWVRDPDEVAWETFVSHGSITHYGADGDPSRAASSKVPGKNERCCA
jgi:catechol 2,3-dioxygenase-like lactoylglutathione lyase family enzyme